MRNKNLPIISVCCGIVFLFTIMFTLTITHGTNLLQIATNSPKNIARLVDKGILRMAPYDNLDNMEATSVGGSARPPHITPNRGPLPVNGIPNLQENLALQQLHIARMALKVTCLGVAVGCVTTGWAVYAHYHPFDMATKIAELETLEAKHSAELAEITRKSSSDLAWGVSMQKI
jgi:hypothetical protein